MARPEDSDTIVGGKGEVVDRLYVIQTMLEQLVCDHPFVTSNSLLAEQATFAVAILGALYQRAANTPATPGDLNHG